MSLLTKSSDSETEILALAASVGSIRTKTAPPAFQLDLLRSLKMYPVLASSVTVLSFALLLLYALTMKPVYEAEAVIYEQPEPAKVLGDNLNVTFDPGRYDSFLQEQIQRMQRPDTIVAALAQLPGSTWAEYGSSQQAAVEGVLANLKVGRVTTSFQIALTLKGSDPRKTAEMANAVASSYLDLIHKQTVTETDERAGLLSEERQRVASALRRDQEEQSALGVSLGVANSNGEGDPYEGELESFREQLAQARNAHDAAAAQLSSLNGQQDHGLALAAAADEAILSDAGLSTLKASVSERRATLRGQMSGMTPDNPLRQRDQEELADLDRSLEEMTAKLRTKAERDLQENLRTNLQRTGNIETRIRSQLAQRTAAAINSTPKLQRAAEVNEDLKRLLLRNAEIDDAIRNLPLEVNRPGVARLISLAPIPSVPEGSRKRLLLIAAFPFSLLIGSAAAATARKCNGTIYTGPDVDSALSFPPLAVLPASDEVVRDVLEKNVLRMAGSIESAYRAKSMRTFLFAAVSSHTDIEMLNRMLLEKLCEIGIDACRTTTADLLLAVDSNQLANPEFIETTGMSSTPAASTKNQGFVNAKLTLLQARHSLVLIKGSTLAECAETEYVARCADATILVAESAVTTRAELIHAAELLQLVHVPGIGVVIQEFRKRYTAPAIRVAKKCSFEKQVPVHDRRETKQNFHSESIFTPSEQPGMVFSKESDTQDSAFADSDPACLASTKSEFSEFGTLYNDQRAVDASEHNINNQITQFNIVAPPVFLSNSFHIEELISRVQWANSNRQNSCKPSPHLNLALASHECSGAFEDRPAIAGFTKLQPVVVTSEHLAGQDQSLVRHEYAEQSRSTLDLKMQRSPVLFLNVQGSRTSAEVVDIDARIRNVAELQKYAQFGLYISFTRFRGTVDSQFRPQVGRFGWTISTSEHCSDKQPESGTSEHFLNLTIPQTPRKLYEERQSTQPVSPMIDCQWALIAGAQSARKEWRNHSFSVATPSAGGVDCFKCQTQETHFTALQNDNLDTESMLTRQWSLLSRFQQRSKLLMSSHTAEPHEKSNQKANQT